VLTTNSSELLLIPRLRVSHIIQPHELRRLGNNLEETHDRLREKKGSWKYAFKTMSHLREVGIAFGCNTQINRLSAPELPCIYECIRDAGARA
jgi:MoaA/NifB/PqqE/SkfB family radical SAM enzyme